VHAAAAAVRLQPVSRPAALLLLLPVQGQELARGQQRQMAPQQQAQQQQQRQEQQRVCSALQQRGAGAGE
jgi:hypothetical protein